ncbi:MAG: RNA polymerase sigma factor [Bacteroidota bacterium]
MSNPDPRFVVEAVIALQQMDNHALAAKFLYTLYVKELLTVAFRITNHMPEAEDLVQEAFLKSFDKINQLKDPNHYGAWVKRILINHCLKVKKKALVFEELPEQETQIESEKEEQWYLQIPLATINNAIQALPSGCRTVFTLHLMDGYKHREVADMLGIELSTAKSQYRYALKRLRALLLPHRNQFL